MGPIGTENTDLELRGHTLVTDTLPLAFTMSVALGSSASPLTLSSQCALNRAAKANTLTWRLPRKGGHVPPLCENLLWFPCYSENRLTSLNPLGHVQPVSFSPAWYLSEPTFYYHPLRQCAPQSQRCSRCASHLRGGPGVRPWHLVSPLPRGLFLAV